MRSKLLFNGIVLSLLAAPLPAFAAPADGGAGTMVVAWTTWMRAGPSEQARAIDEIGTGTPVQVVACSEGWCQIQQDRALGYVQQRMLAVSLQRLQPGTGTCFPARYYTAESLLPLTICPAQAAP